MCVKEEWGQVHGTGNWELEASICLDSGSWGSPWGINWHSGHDLTVQDGVRRLPKVHSELCLAVAAFVCSKVLCTSCRTGGSNQHSVHQQAKQQ